jgi:hypothetical protein
MHWPLPSSMLKTMQKDVFKVWYRYDPSLHTGNRGMEIFHRVLNFRRQIQLLEPSLRVP